MKFRPHYPLCRSCRCNTPIEGKTLCVLCLATPLSSTTVPDQSDALQKDWDRHHDASYVSSL